MRFWCGFKLGRGGGLGFMWWEGDGDSGDARCRPRYRHLCYLVTFGISCSVFIPRWGFYYKLYAHLLV